MTDPGLTELHHRTSTTRLVLITIVVLIIVAVIVIAGIVPRERAKAALRIETNDLAVPTVAVIQAKRGSPQQEIVLPGNMQPFIESPIYARTNGYLKKWTHDIGAHVKTGELLAEIETPEVDAQLEQARSDLNTAIANMKLAQVTAERYESLRNTDSVSKQDVDTAASDYVARKAMVASAESSVKRYEQLQSFEKVYAPFDGVITARHTDVGNLINSGNAGPAQELFRIASIQKLRVFVNVPQQYSRDARIGLIADLTLPQFPERRFKGILVRTANSIDLASRTLLVEVDVENPRGELLPGAYTEVHLKIPSNVPTFILPVTALIFQAQGMQVAEVDGNHRAQLKPITIGRDFGAEVEIVAGLSGAEQIINNPPDSLVSGEEVRITPAEGGRNKP
ncbi:MAG: efflux RND transporter periplasmic adaptor subunit [Acidobacteriia bacterium]|nr:efflux RND transporter periplasmic adaptor subunit [Terriglobia bacterium]